MRTAAIASCVKTHGRNGEVVVVPIHGLASYMREGLEVALVPPALKGDRWKRVASCSGDDAGQLVAFEGVTSIDEAAALVGKTVLVRASDLPEGALERSPEALCGREVEDAELGALGTIVEVLRSPAQDVLVIEGAYGEVMLPVVDEYVLELPAQGPIRVAAPRGLVEGGSA